MFAASEDLESVMGHRIQRHTSKEMTERARQLRQDATIPERILWNHLRNRQLGGLKFRRQQPIGPYVADFYCESARLVVELDGRSHDDHEQADARRDAYMRGLGLVVLRVPNDELLHNREGVLETVLREADASLTSRPSP